MIWVSVLNLGHKIVSDHQGLKYMEVLKTCKERYGGPQRVCCWRYIEWMCVCVHHWNLILRFSIPLLQQRCSEDKAGFSTVHQLLGLLITLCIFACPLKRNWEPTPTIAFIINCLAVSSLLIIILFIMGWLQPDSMWLVTSSFWQILADGADWWIFYKVALNGTLMVVPPFIVPSFCCTRFWLYHPIWYTV